ncbi:MAG TPA: sucrase ferredoxin [Candidatus Nanopelagicales bacterium]
MIDPTQQCSVLSEQLAEPLAGSAPLARTWVVLEQPGPFGFKALHQSHLPKEIGDAFAAATDKSSVTVLLARPVGPHADHHHPGSHRFWVAHVAPGGVRMRTGTVADLSELVTADLPEVMARAGRGELPPWGRRTDEPLLLVCTNGSRDVCCALNGRPLAAELAQDPAYAGQVIEVSHLGGHRFSPTALLLPTGMSYGRLTARTARLALDQARHRRLSIEGARGLTALARPAQAADLMVRRTQDVQVADAIDVLRSSPVGKLTNAPLRWDGDGLDAVTLVVRHEDGRAWNVTVQRVLDPTPRAESCGKAPVPGRSWVAADPVPTHPWR